MRVIIFLCLFTVLTGANAADAVLDVLTNPDKEEAASDDAGKSIVPETSPLDDFQIERRLEKIFSELEDMSSIEVNVQNSVVDLRGEVSTYKTLDRAEEIASQVEGVVEVNNELFVSRDISQRVVSTWQRLKMTATETVSLLPLLLLSLLLIIAFWIAAKKLANQRQWFLRVAPNAFIAELFANVVRLTITVLGVVLALHLLDATSIIGTLLGAAGIIGLAVGFAVRDTVENYISSVLLSLRNPFAIHDYVRINDYEGSVARLTSRATILISADGNKIRIPNALVFKSVIVNFSEQPMRRFSSTVPIDESENLATARKIVLDTLADTPGICDDPAPLVVVNELGEAVTKLQIYGWVNQKEHHFLKVKTAALSRIKVNLKKASIVMPESVQTIRLEATDGLLGNIGSSEASPGTDRQRDSATDVQSAEAIHHTEEDMNIDQSITDQVLEEQHGRENLLTSSSVPE